MPADPEALELALPARADNVSLVRRAVTAYARTAGIDGDAIGDVALAVGEACANVVVHAYSTASSEEEAMLEVRASMDRGRLVVVISDNGLGMAPRPDSPGLGLGLPLMASLTDSLELRESRGGGTEVWMTFGARSPSMRFERTA